MRKIYLLVLISFSIYCNGQYYGGVSGFTDDAVRNDMLNREANNRDARLIMANSSRKAHKTGEREDFVESLRGFNNDERQYDIEGSDFVVITKIDNNDKALDPEKTQKVAVDYCFSQLHQMITHFQNKGNIFSSLENKSFEGVIFKTNTVFWNKTIRYHFKFSLDELKAFPEHVAASELFEYIAKNKNDIYNNNH